MSKPMLIRYSPLSKRWYAFTSYKTAGKVPNQAVVVTGKKWDVTEQIETIIEAAREETKG